MPGIRVIFVQFNKASSKVSAPAGALLVAVGSAQVDRIAEMLTKEQRLFDLIYKKKDDLFGKFSARRSADDIDKDWQSLWDECVRTNMPFVTVNRGPRYLRDNVWQYIRRKSMVTQQYFLLTKMRSVQEKLDENRKTGAAGGREAQARWTSAFWISSGVIIQRSLVYVTIMRERWSIVVFQLPF